MQMEAKENKNWAKELDQREQKLVFMECECDDNENPLF